jgi:ferredoxin
MKVRVNSDVCQGHARCWQVAPDIFELDDMGHAVVSVADLQGEAAEKARTAAINCPERAISVED